MLGRRSLLQAVLTLAAVSMFGCVNLDKKNKSDIPYPPQRSPVASMTPDAIAVAAQKAQTGSKKFTDKLKQVVMPKTQDAYHTERIARDDPTSLQHKVGPIGPDLYLASARLAERNGALESAMDQYRRALRADSRNRNAMIGLARLQHRTGDMDGAIQVYRKALETYRNDPVILNDLGLCYARNGQLKQAISVLRSAADAAPEREMYRNNLAAALVEAHRADEAVAHLTRIHGAAAANYNVGYLLVQGGDNRAASPYLEKALQLDPSLQQARTLLGETVEQVSSLPPRAENLGSAGYQPPVAPREDSPLTRPENLQRPPGTNEPVPPEAAPQYLERSPTRFGPFGYVPPSKRQTEAMLVSYSEPLEAPEPQALKPAYPRLQPVYAVTLPLCMPAPGQWVRQGDHVPPTP